MGVTLIRDQKKLLSIRHEWHLIGRYTDTRKFFFWKKVFVVQDLKPVVELGLWADCMIYQYPEDAVRQYESMRLERR